MAGPVTLKSGREVEYHAIDIMDLVLSGEAPNVVLDVFVFEHWGKPDDTYAELARIMIEARLMVIARGLTRPRLRLGPVEDLRAVQPNRDRGEIGPTGPGALTPAEIFELHRLIIGESVPAAADAPFQSDAPDAQGAPEGESPGDPVPHAAERDAGTPAGDA